MVHMYTWVKQPHKFPILPLELTLYLSTFTKLIINKLFLDGGMMKTALLPHDLHHPTVREVQVHVEEITTKMCILM